MSDIFTSVLQGIPCQVKIESFTRVSGSFRADNPGDYYGYTEVEVTILDRKGYDAPWLEHKMTPGDEERIAEEAILYWASTHPGPDDDEGPSYKEDF